MCVCACMHCGAFLRCVLCGCGCVHTFDLRLRRRGESGKERRGVEIFFFSNLGSGGNLGLDPDHPKLPPPRYSSSRSNSESPLPLLVLSLPPRAPSGPLPLVSPLATRPPLASPSACPTIFARHSLTSVGLCFYGMLLYYSKLNHTHT